MTRSDAIKILRRLSEPEAWETQITEEAFEALAIATDALQQCQELPGIDQTDPIDRALAQTAIQLEAKRMIVATEAHGAEMVKWSENIVTVTDAMNALRFLPAARPKNICCGECKYYSPKVRMCNDLVGFGRYWEPTDFCSYGVKDDEQGTT